MKPKEGLLLNFKNRQEKCFVNDNELSHNLNDIIKSIVMLIIEGRIPDSDSNRGYKEGYHVFNAFKDATHECIRSNKKCQNAIQIKNNIEQFLKNLTTTSTANTKFIEINNQKNENDLNLNIEIDVCLLSNCCYDVLNGHYLINLMSKNNLTYEIIEKWSLNLIMTHDDSSKTLTPITDNNKKIDTKIIYNQFYNAIKSYLHFSQISSWLNQHKGYLPKTLGYSLKTTLTKEPTIIDDYCDSHSFPIINFNNGLKLNINLISKKRSNLLPQLICNQKCLEYTHFNNNNNDDDNELMETLSSTNETRRRLSSESYDNELRQIKNIRSLSPTTSTSLCLPIKQHDLNQIQQQQNDNNNDLCQSPKVLVSTSLFLNEFQNNLKIFDLNNNECDSIDEDSSITNTTKQTTRKIPDSIQFIRSPTDGVRIPIFKTFSRQRQLNSSPAPLRKQGTSAFQFDNSLNNVKSIKNAFNEDTEELKKIRHKFMFDTSNLNLNTRPLCLLGNFEESLLNGRLNPVGTVDGFYAELGASGSFFPDHVKLPVNAAFYHICDDIAASPYLGVINLEQCSKRGYKVPNKGTIQVTLFNPNNTVVKMFVVMYDLSDMPPNNRTFLRQRTMYVPLSNETNYNLDLKSYLRYLIHLRFATSKTGKLYLHSNIKLIFARNKCEIDPRLAKYEYKTFTEAPKNPRYSCKK